MGFEDQSGVASASVSRAPSRFEVGGWRSVFGVQGLGFIEFGVRGSVEFEVQNGVAQAGTSQGTSASVSRALHRSLQPHSAGFTEPRNKNHVNPLSCTSLVAPNPTLEASQNLQPQNL